MDCPFCSINLDKTRIVQEGEHTKVILSNPRLVSGHLLIVPNRHVERISELRKDEKTELFEQISIFQEKIITNFAKGCDIRQNYRPFQKQSDLKVNHLHIHLQPRELEDELYKKCQIHEAKIFRELSKEEMEKFSRLFSN